MTDPSTTPDTGRTIYTVSELNNTVRDLLEHSFPLMWVEGEISNLAKPRSGHWYFSLKDAHSQVRCAMFRNKNQFLRFAPQDGDKVMLRAKIGLYSARGEYQIIVEHMEPAGAGALQRAFEQLKAKLSAEGLFDEELKRPLPATPRRIGVITSATGAALHDVLSVLRRRYPLGQVLLHPVLVQGPGAAPAISKALQTAGERHECDVLLLVRGGGSLEDLWAFNEESVARAIRACPIPVVSGVGHEVDVSISDYAADLRAPTPSAAAELVCPDKQAWVNKVTDLQRRLAYRLSQRTAAAGLEINTLHQRLQRLHPERQLQEHMQRLDALEQHLRRTMTWKQGQQHNRLQHAHTRLLAVGPKAFVIHKTGRVEHLFSRLIHAMQRLLEQRNTRWQIAGRGLNAISPLNTLERGYAIAENDKNKIITDARKVKPGENLHITLHQGHLHCEVVKTHTQSTNN